MKPILALALVVAATACAVDDAPRGRAALAVPVAEPADTSSIDTLRGLDRILIDASSLYDQAANASPDASYAGELRRLAAARRALIPQFDAEIARIGGQPPREGQALGAMHRAFLEARLLGSSDSKVAVDEALRGENYLVDELRRAVADRDISVETRRFLEGKLDEVTRDRERLAAFARTLRGS